MAYGFAKKRVVSDIKRVYVIIPAAGIGSRMESDENKQFIEIDGVPVITRTLRTFKQFANDLFASGIQLKAVVVTQQEYIYRVKSIVKREGFDFVHAVVEGGETRTDSVWKGIEALNEFPFPPMDSDVIFIHDGARCLVDQELLIRCLEGAANYEICAVAVDVKSTIKQVGTRASITKAKADSQPAASQPSEEDLSKLPPIARLRASALFKPMNTDTSNSPFVPSPSSPFAAPAKPEEPVEVASTPDRDGLKEVQTPQVFRYNKLLQSYLNARRNNIQATDDTSLAEAMHYKVNLIEGSYNNIKITTPEDVTMAEAILKKMAAAEASKIEE